MDIRLDRLS